MKRYFARIQEFISKNRRALAFALLFVLVYIPFVNAHGVDLIKGGATDFPSYYAAAVAAFQRDASPFADAGGYVAQELFPERSVWAYLYPPPSLVFFYPFSLIPYEAAKVTMLALNHLMLLASTFLMFRILKLDLSHPFALFSLIYVISFFPLLITLEYGQTNILLLLLLCVAWVALAKGKHPAYAAVPLAFSIILKLYPALFLVYLFIRKKYGVVIWTIVLVLLFIVITLPLLPDGVWADWFNEVALAGGYGSWVRGQSPATPENQSINGFTSRIFLGHEKVQPLLPNDLALKIAPYILCGIVLLVTLLAVLRRPKEKQGEFSDNEFALFGITMTLVAPISWDHHYTFLLLMILLALYQLIESDVDYRWLAVLIPAALILAYYFPFRHSFIQRGWQTLLISIKLYALMGFWAYYVVKVRKQKTEQGTK